jgi:excinuclease UvrABC nuclease subunit
MPIKGEKQRLNRKNVDLAPAAPGVYALFANHEVTYYGAARQGETIRDRLGQHLAGQQQPGRTGATTATR